MHTNIAFLNDQDTALLERPSPSAAPSVTVYPAKKATPAMDFKQAACELPQMAHFSVSVVKARSWQSCDRLQVNMLVGRRTFLVVDEMAEQDVLPGQTMEEKKQYLTEIYTAACRSLSVSFEERGREPDGWRVAHPESDRTDGSHFVMLHHGVDRLRAWVGVETGTEARRALGRDSGRHERCMTLLAPFYNV